VFKCGSHACPARSRAKALKSNSKRVYSQQFAVVLRISLVVCIRTLGVVDVRNLRVSKLSSFGTSSSGS
jgi:hypothetical protein